jgi:lipopolysaccharide export system protein LptC
MRDRLTQIIAIVLLATITAISYWYAQLLRKPTSAPPPIPGTPDFTAARLVLTQFDASGSARFKLFADEMLHYGEDDKVELTRPRLVSLAPDRPQIEVRAQRGRVDNLGEQVHLEGAVQVQRSASAGMPAMKLSTEYLLALPDLDRYSTDRPVEVERGTSRISAGSMELDNIARTARFGGRARIQLAPVSADGR